MKGHPAWNGGGGGGGGGGSGGGGGCELEAPLAALLSKLGLESCSTALGDGGVESVDDVRLLSEQELISDLGLKKMHAKKLIAGAVGSCTWTGCVFGNHDSFGKVVVIGWAGGEFLLTTC